MRNNDLEIITDRIIYDWDQGGSKLADSQIVLLIDRIGELGVAISNAFDDLTGIQDGGDSNTALEKLTATSWQLQSRLDSLRKRHKEHGLA